MKAAVVNVLGQPPQYQDFPEPVAAENEILVKINAAGLHPIVKARASGTHYSSTGEVPMVAGLDAVGTRPDGSRVYCGNPRRPWGTMAELCAAPAAICLPLPDGIDDLQAAAIANPGMSAWLSLKECAQVAGGQTVLILGTTGGATGHPGGAASGRVVGVGRNVEALADAGLDAVIALGKREDGVREAFTAEAASGIDVANDYLLGAADGVAAGSAGQGMQRPLHAGYAAGAGGRKRRPEHYAACRHPTQRGPEADGQRLWHPRVSSTFNSNTSSSKWEALFPRRSYR